MMKTKHVSFYQLFPVISIVCLFVEKITLLYYDSNPQLFPPRIVQFIHLSYLYPIAILFFIAYLIPLFFSFQIEQKGRKLLVLAFLVVVSFYLILSTYLFFFSSTRFFADNYHLLVGALCGVLLGCVHASTAKKFSFK